MRLTVRLVLAMLAVAAISMMIVPAAQLFATRTTFEQLPDGFRQRVAEFTAPPPPFRPPDREMRVQRLQLMLPADGFGPAGERNEAQQAREENLRLYTLVGDFRTTQQQALLAGVLIALFTALGLASWLSRSIGRPIEAVSHATSRLARGAFGTRVELRHEALQPLEARTLALDFNAMAESLEQSEEERKAMIADIAHELRNPLATMQMRLEAIRDGLVEMNPEEIDLLMRQTQLLIRLVEDLRTLSLADAGRLNLQLGMLDLREVARQAVDSMRPAAKRRRLGVDLILPGEPVRVLGDHQRLTQILGNLLDNAFHCTPPGGRVEVEVEMTPDSALLAIRDQGPGIAPDQLDTIFERFVQGRRRDNQESTGLGLGLAIVRSLTRLHGGTVQARNLSEGAELQVRLPLQLEATLLRQQAESEPFPNHRQTLQSDH